VQGRVAAEVGIGTAVQGRFPGYVDGPVACVVLVATGLAAPGKPRFVVVGHVVQSYQTRARTLRPGPKHPTRRVQPNEVCL